MTTKQFWLMKSEPDTFSIADLERVKTEPWSGVRSMFARFHMRNMNVGDEVLFHHSSCNPPGVVGTARVVRTKVIDETQFDPKSPYFDEKATREKPIWDCVDVEYVSTFPYLVSMDRLRADPALADMIVLRPGRLSVQPVQAHEFARVVELGQIEPPPPPPKAPRKKAASKAKAGGQSKMKTKATPKAGGKAKPKGRAKSQAEPKSSSKKDKR